MTDRAIGRTWQRIQTRIQYPLLIGGVLLLTMWAYKPATRAAFVFEDGSATAYEMPVQPPVQWLRVRSLTRLSYRWDRWVGGNRPLAYHLTNVGLHLVNSLLVLWLIVALGYTPRVAIWSAAVFLLHPLQSETVMYIAGRTELLSTGFLLIAAILVRRQAWAAAGLCFLLAIMSKEAAVIGLGLLVLVDLHGRRDRTWWRTALASRVFKGTLAVVGVGVIAMAVTVWVNEYVPQMRSGLSTARYVALQATALWTYLAMVVAPATSGVFAQSMDHDFEAIPMIWQWLALGGLVYVAILVGILWLFRDDLDPLTRTVVFGSAWVLVAILPRFIMRVPETLTEHHMYLPLVGLALIAGTVAERLAAYEPGHACDRATAPAQ